MKNQKWLKTSKSKLVKFEGHHYKGNFQSNKMSKKTELRRRIESVVLALSYSMNVKEPQVPVTVRRRNYLYNK